MVSKPRQEGGAWRGRPLAVLLPLAFLVRAAVALGFPNMIAPDETYQALEQAHRLVFGFGVVPWEFRVGMRNWLIPGLLAAPMAIGRWFSPDPLLGLALIRLSLCGLSLPMVACALLWARRIYGLGAAWMAGLIATFWPDLWLMAPHPLEEVIAADLLIPALYFIASPRAPRVGLAAFLLGLAFVVRNELAPAVAVAGIFLCGKEVVRWRRGLLFGALPVLAAGMLDWLTWGTPFRSFALNLYLNTLGHVASDYGTEPISYYPLAFVLDWTWAIGIVVWAAARAARVLPAGVATAAAILLTHLFVPHKEWRFMFPALAILAVLCAVMLGGAVARLPRAMGAALVAVLASGLLASPLTPLFLDRGVDAFALSRDVARLHPRSVGVSYPDWWIMPGDLLFGPDTRLSPLDNDLPRSFPFAGFDAVIGVAGRIDPPARFRILACLRPPLPMILGGKTPLKCAWVSDSTGGPVPAGPERFGIPKSAIPFILPGH